MLTSDRALLLIIDVQEAFVPHIHEMERVIGRTSILSRGAQLLEVPILVTEQYPRGLGATAAGVREALPQDVRVYEKVHFNCLGDEAIRKAVAETGRREVILAGIEAHICVSQTALALLEAGYEVTAAADAISSRQVYDKEIALERLRGAGVIVTTVEAALMEMTVSSKHEKFREISKLIK